MRLINDCKWSLYGEEGEALGERLLRAMRRAATARRVACKRRYVKEAVAKYGDASGDSAAEGSRVSYRPHKLRGTSMFATPYVIKWSDDDPQPPQYSPADIMLIYAQWRKPTLHSFPRLLRYHEIPELLPENPLVEPGALGIKNQPSEPE